MSGAKFPKILAVIGIVFYTFVNWYAVKFNNPNIFDSRTGIIIDAKVQNLIILAKIIIIIIATFGIIVEFSRLRKKMLRKKENVMPEFIGIFLNLMLLSFLTIPFWTLFYTPI